MDLRTALDIIMNKSCKNLIVGEHLTEEKRRREEELVRSNLQFSITRMRESRVKT